MSTKKNTLSGMPRWTGIVGTKVKKENATLPFVAWEGLENGGVH